MLSIYVHSQQMEKNDFQNIFKENFEIDSLKNYDNSKLPIGIYSFCFDITKDGKIDNYIFSTDSVQLINSLVKQTLDKILFSKKIVLKTNRYAVFIFFNFYGNNSLPDSININENNLYSLVLKELTKIYNNISTSFIKNTFSGNYYLLPSVLINNENSKHPKGVSTDIPNKMTEEDKKKMIKKMEELKNKSGTHFK